MKLNKKAEGTASTFLISSIIGIFLLIIIGLLVNGLSDIYSADNINYFDGYSDVYGNMTNVGNDFVGDYDLNQNETNVQITRTEDFLFFKSFEIVRKIPNILTYTTIGITRISGDLGIPPIFTGMLMAVLGIVLIVGVIKVIRGFKDV